MTQQCIATFHRFSFFMAGELQGYSSLSYRRRPRPWESTNIWKTD